MKLISLENAINIASDFIAYNENVTLSELKKRLEECQTIDPVEIIEEMIEEVGTKPNDPRTDAQSAILEELKSRLSANPSSHV